MPAAGAARSAVALLHVRPAMTIARIDFGKTGEDLACRELERRGYAILARRWRCRAGEIDIIARDGGTTVFIEVKARDGGDYGEAAAAVTPAKRRRIVRLALEYLARQRRLDAPCRFDVVSVDMRNDQARVQVFQHAFDAS